MASISPVPSGDLTHTCSPRVHINIGQEHFLKEIESIRRRLLALESEAQKTTTTAGAVPGFTREQYRSIAQEEASEKAQEVRVSWATTAHGSLGGSSFEIFALLGVGISVGTVFQGSRGNKAMCAQVGGSSVALKSTRARTLTFRVPHILSCRYGGR